MSENKKETFTVNGEERILNETLSVAQILEEMDIQLDRRGVAVAVNGELVTRAEWPTKIIENGDLLEVVQAIQGGLI